MIKHSFSPRYSLIIIFALVFPLSLFSQTVLNVPNGLNGIGSTVSGNNIGIGTANPLSKLDIEGMVQIGWNTPSFGVGLSSTGVGGGGWARRYGFFKNSDNSLLGGFGGMGHENTLDYLWIGNEYNNYSAAFYPNGPILLNGNIGVNGNYSTISSIPATGNIELTTQGAGIIMKDETSSNRYHLHFHGDKLRQWDGSTELTYLTNSTGLSYTAWADLDGILTSPYYQNQFGWTNTNCPGGDGYGSYINIGAVGDRYGSQLFVSYSTPELWFRQIANGTTRGWKKVANSDNPVFTGNVGIGTANPSAKLHINGGEINISGSEGAGATRLVSYDSGKSFWVISPNLNSYNSIVIADAHDWDRSLQLIYTPGTTGAGAGDLIIGQIGKNSATYTHGITRFFTNGTERVRINKDGNLLIGKESQTNAIYRLDVSGKIRADEIVVNTTGADFVFDSEYKLSDLSEIEKFISDNKHLPGIPSAEETKEEGMSMSEMQTKLLQKIEELTLYIIEQEKRMKEQGKELKVLIDEIEILKAEVRK